MNTTAARGTYVLPIAALVGVRRDRRKQWQFVTQVLRSYWGREPSSGVTVDRACTCAT